MLRLLFRLFGLGPRRRYDPVPRAVRRTLRVVERTAVVLPASYRAGQVLQGKGYVIDGDTLVIDGTHIRLTGIDAPELDQPWGQKAKFAMIALRKGRVIRAEIVEGETYGRVVAKCTLPDGTDLSAALVRQGLALDWARFSGGAYRHLEPEGVRKKLWRVEAKHRGRLTIDA